MFNMDNYQKVRKDMEELMDLAKESLATCIETADVKELQAMALMFRVMSNATQMLDEYVNGMNHIDMKLDKILENQQKLLKA